MEYLKIGDKHIGKLKNEYFGRTIEITDQMIDNDENTLEFLHYYGFEQINKNKQ